MTSRSFVISGIAVGLAAFALTGCLESSTYGTGKSQEQHLLDGLTSVVGGGSKKERVEYIERPKIVKPTLTAALPAPGASKAAFDESAWPASPQAQIAKLKKDLESPNPAVRGAAKRALLRFDQTKLADSSKRREQLLAAAGIDSSKTELTTTEQGALYRAAQARRNGGSANGRRFLSEPPTAYRQPVATAASGDLGMSEKQKRKCLAKKGSAGIFGSLGGNSKQCKAYLASLNLVDGKAVAPTPQPIVAAIPDPQPVIAAKPKPVVAAAPPRPVAPAAPQPIETALPTPAPIVAAAPPASARKPVAAPAIASAPQKAAAVTTENGNKKVKILIPVGSGTSNALSQQDKRSCVTALHNSGLAPEIAVQGLSSSCREYLRAIGLYD